MKSWVMTVLPAMREMRQMRQLRQEMQETRQLRQEMQESVQEPKWMWAMRRMRRAIDRVTHEPDMVGSAVRRIQTLRPVPS